MRGGAGRSEAGALQGGARAEGGGDGAVGAAVLAVRAGLVGGSLLHGC
jgi:hypothetical protein